MIAATATDFYQPTESLLVTMVREIRHERDLDDDLIQEARIHVWRVQQSKPGRSNAFYNKCARTRIREVSTRQTFLGHTGRRGYPADPLRRPHDSLDEGWEK
jgi:hypothetical protein